MTRRLEGRVAIVTGAGRGLGRAHALHLAAHGAKVIVNDIGADVDGTGHDPTPAEQVTKEIAAAGGVALASHHDVAVWQQACELVRLAVDTFGDLHVLVNNAGILRDRTLARMTEEEWDEVIRVHLRGHAAPTRHATAYWRERARAGQEVDASVIMTSSAAGLAGNFGQANYASAKLAVLALSRCVMIEYEQYGVRSNVVSPGGRTRLSLSSPGTEQQLTRPDGLNFDPYEPVNVSPLILWLAAPGCPANGQVFHLVGDRLIVSALPPIVHDVRLGHPWTLEDLDRELPSRLVVPTEVHEWLPGDKLAES